MILPVSLSLDIETADERARFVWVVYSDNPQRGAQTKSELPYLAHYVTMDGEYLYSLETIIPGDTAGEAGFEASYVFEFMEPVDYTGYVDMYDGSEQEFTETEDDAEGTAENPGKAMADIIIQDFTDNLTQKLGEIRSVDDVLDLFTITIKGGDVTVIPSTGLEAITLPEPCDPTEKAPAELPEPGKKSRPKL